VAIVIVMVRVTVVVVATVAVVRLVIKYSCKVNSVAMRSIMQW
jgi:hypothetical protein